MLTVLAARSAAVGDDSPSFRGEVMAVLSRAACNAGTCHGNAHGKGGLKLSLRGQDPDADFRTLTRQLGGRRANALQPTASLLLLKPTMSVPHQGGRRFGIDSHEYQRLKSWIAAGMPDDSPHAPRVVGISAQPSHATVHAPKNSVAVKVEARFSDGTRRDVTELAVFDSSALFVSINSSGVATAGNSGRTTITVRYLNHQIPVRLEFVPHRVDFSFRPPAAENFVDRAVFQQLQRLRVNPSPVCDDTTFLRRAHLDLTGLSPTAKQAREFVASSNPDKRAKLVDELLASDEFNDMQALRWADLLRVEVKTLDETGVRVFHSWIRESFAKRKPLNLFAKELIEARGSTYKVPATNLYRTLRNPESRAESTAQLFLGIRLQCAKCHNHPFDRWTQDDYYDWSNFFARIDYKIVENKRADKFDKHEFNGEQIVLIKDQGDVKNPRTGKLAGLRFLGASAVDTATKDKKQDRLQRLASWIGSATNQRFAATQANRIWFQLMGRGVVDPVDDFRTTNPPGNPELLDSLTQEFIEHKFDVRHLMRVIMNSQTYQLASTPNETNQHEDGLFARCMPRRLSAEQTLDAVAGVLGAPVAFGGQPRGIKAVQLAGVRNGGHRYSPPEIGDKFLTLFGKPGRLLTCECERSEETTLAQTFELVSGQLIDELLRGSTGLITNALKGVEDRVFLNEFYWSALSRAPSKVEVEAAVSHIRGQSNRRRGLEDVAWAVLNSNEFLIRR
ncbi:MAG: DUF1549 and DUF1553 domain-containing protein [Planctomycetota bacterium]|nr:DUF1549 and DUF1553 domain-containing protein [Planctomycetota bacterium]